VFDLKKFFGPKTMVKLNNKHQEVKIFSQEAGTCLANQEIAYLLCNVKFD
jgi:hypothetical protein